MTMKTAAQLAQSYRKKQPTLRDSVKQAKAARESKSGAAGGNPSPEVIKTARTGLTQAQAAALVGVGRIQWIQWERGHKPMPLDRWELFQFKAPNPDIDQEFDKFASGYNCEGDEWQDMGADQYFAAGYRAAMAKIHAARDTLCPNE